MKVDKIVSMHPVHIAGFTILSVEEYNRYRPYIPPVDDYWWLRTPHFAGKNMANCVDPKGNRRSTWVGEMAKVRPVMKFDAPLNSLEVGDTLILGSGGCGYEMTYLKDGLAISNEARFTMCFRSRSRNWEADDANEYDASNVKIYIDERYQKDLTVKKLVPMNLDITAITLLSIEEYKVAEDNIPPVDNGWWLRSPGGYRFNAACVYPGGVVDDYGATVSFDFVGVRPALRFNPTSLNLQIGEKVLSGGFTWTHVSEGLLLCDRIITQMPFRKDWQAEDADKYEASDVKKYIEELYQSWKENKK